MDRIKLTDNQKSREIDSVSVGVASMVIGHENVCIFANYNEIFIIFADENTHGGHVHATAWPTFGSACGRSGLALHSCRYPTITSISLQEKTHIYERTEEISGY